MGADTGVLQESTAIETGGDCIRLLSSCEDFTSTVTISDKLGMNVE